MNSYGTPPQTRKYWGRASSVQTREVMEHTEYRFRVTQPVNYDAHVLWLVRYTWDDELGYRLDLNTLIKSEVLTVDGWREQRGWEMVDITDLPHMNGLELTHRQETIDVLDDWETHIRGYLNHVSS